jgi:V/A-type H+-transporting ATPase subunit A
VEGGVLASLVEEVDWGPIVQARDATGSQDAAGVQSRRDVVLAALDALEAGRGMP